MAVNNPYIWGTGRRKTATARVRIKPGTGKFTVNGREFEQFFVTDDSRRQAAMPLTVTESRNNYDIWANVDGDGRSVRATRYDLCTYAAARVQPNSAQPARGRHARKRGGRGPHGHVQPDACESGYPLSSGYVSTIHTALNR